MFIVFCLAFGVAVAATLLTITATNAVHGLLYLVISLLAVAVSFYTLGAPFAAALEVIVYAGAIMVLFLFAVMTLDAGQIAEASPFRQGFSHWLGPVLLCGALLAGLGYLVITGEGSGESSLVLPKAVGVQLYGPYLLAVELASLLLLAGLVGTYHLVRPPALPPNPLNKGTTKEGER